MRTKIPSTSTDDLGRRSVRGGMFNMGSQGVSVALQLLSTIVLARLLTPESYGLIGMVMVVITFSALFKDLGLSAATIQRKELTVDGGSEHPRQEEPQTGSPILQKYR